MNTDLETIENYLTGQLSTDERIRFEAALRTDPAVADTLAFYVLTRQVARQQAREERLAELNALRTSATRLGRRTSGNWITYMATAASIVLLLGLGWSFFRLATEPKGANSQQIDAYVAAHFMQLPTTMGGSADSLAQGIDLFNKGKLSEAGALFQDLATRQPTLDNALKYAGIVAFRQGNYDQAINQFHRLSQRTDLFVNPGLFYESLARLKRNRPMDKEQAKKLLEQVIDRKLEGKREAETLLTSL